MNEIETESFQNMERGLKILLPFSGKPHNKVAGDTHVRHGISKQGNNGRIFFHRIPPVHSVEHRVAPRLDGKVQGRANYRVPLDHGGNDLWRKILGMIRGKSEPPQPRKGRTFSKKPGKRPGIIPIGAITVHILSQKGYFQNPLMDKNPGFFQDFPGIPGLEAAPHIGYDAIGAEIIASMGDGYKRLPGVGPTKRCAVEIFKPPRILVEKEPSLSPG
jgi:hypothetical protein